METLMIQLRNFFILKIFYQNEKITKTTGTHKVYISKGIMIVALKLKAIYHNQKTEIRKNKFYQPEARATNCSHQEISAQDHSHGFNPEDNAHYSIKYWRTPGTWIESLLNISCKKPFISELNRTTSLNDLVSQFLY
jgi:hypothetical protein